MKIHTTQNLGSLERKKSTNIVAQNELSFPRLQEKSLNKIFSENTGMTLVSFRAGKPNSKDAKKVVNSAKKVVGEIKKAAEVEVEKGDKFLLSSFFNALLKVADYEAVVQAAIAAIICVFLRPLAIMALPTGSKSKDINKEAQKIESKPSDVKVEKSEVAFKASSEVSFKGKKNKIGQFLLDTKKHY